MLSRNRISGILHPEPVLAGYSQQVKNTGKDLLIQCKFMNKEEKMISRFFDKVRKNSIREYEKTGKITPKLVFLSRDWEHRSVIVVKEMPELYSVNSDRFLDKYFDFLEKIGRMIVKLDNKGYDAISYVHVELTEDDDHEIIRLDKKLVEHEHYLNIERIKICREPLTVNGTGQLFVPEPQFISDDTSNA
jgi:hypothetical protein